jgi:hypothetical protein
LVGAVVFVRLPIAFVWSGLCERRVPTGPEELVDFETVVLAGFVLAGVSAG